MGEGNAIKSKVRRYRFTAVPHTCTLKGLAIGTPFLKTLMHQSITNTLLKNGQITHTGKLNQGTLNVLIEGNV